MGLIAELTFTIRGWPQAIVVLWYAFYLVVSLALHGKPRDGEHNAVVNMLTMIIAIIILWWGGFF